MHHHLDRTDLAIDPRFADDEFTRAAATERQIDTAHHHMKAALLGLLGAFVLFRVVGKHHGCCSRRYA
jgi:hypothetical protein